MHNLRNFCNPLVIFHSFKRAASVSVVCIVNVLADISSKCYKCLFFFNSTKLGVTTAQVQDQAAYVKQLQTTEADSHLIEQEKLVEKQLRRRMVSRIIFLSIYG